MTERASGGTILNQATYTYDALNRRVGIDDNSSQTWVVYDGSQAYADFNGSGSLTNRYLNAQAVDQLLARTSSGGTTAWYLNDHLGSVRDVVTFSQMGVTILDHLAYDAYGNIIQETSSSNGDRMKYGQLQWDAVAELYQAINRPFDAISGRWITQDPLSFKAGDSNLYRYVNNGPITSTDQLGLDDASILDLDGNGQLQGDVPQKVNPLWSCPQLAQAIQDIETSIKSRQGMVDFFDYFLGGSDEGHIFRIGLEKAYKVKLVKRFRDKCGNTDPVKAPTKPPGEKPTTTTATAVAEANPNPSAPPPPPGGYPPNPSINVLPWYFSNSPVYDPLIDTGVGVSIAIGVVVARPFLPLLVPAVPKLAEALAK